MVETQQPVEVHDTPEEASFRRRVREFLEANAPRRRVPTPEEQQEAQVGPTEAAALDADTDAVARARDYQRRLSAAGLAGLTWPKEYGGQGLGQSFQRIFNEEAADYELPTGVFTIGFGMCGPTILAHGTEEQKSTYIPKMLSGEWIFCQLFSEPGAGSDVASLQTRAVRHGDEWILNGQKVWTSGAQYSDYGCIVARSDVDVPKHQGITMFIVDMKAPGVEIKPLRQMTGGASFNEVFFTDARVPDANVLGEVNKGWSAAITMLMNERVAIGAGGGGGRRAGGAMGGGATATVRMARDAGLWDSGVVRQQLMDIYVRSTILGFVGQRIAAQVKSGVAPGPEGSIAKLSGALISERSANISAAILGARAQAWEDEDRQALSVAQQVLGYKGGAIAGGTNEVMRNIIGERVLGLPKEPQVDRDMPFRELKVGTQRPGS